MNASSPKSSLAKLGLHSKQKPLKIMVLGQTGVGKTALTVRFVTKRFIGEYDSSKEKLYPMTMLVDNELIPFEIMDAPGGMNEPECLSLEVNMRWADAFILLYSVTDKCSFDECNRLKFLINYNKRRRKLGSNNKDAMFDVPVILVGNKIDQWGDRMVSIDEGQRRSKEIACACFHEISVRESVDQVTAVFIDACRFWRVFSKFPKLKRSASDVPNSSDIILSPDCICSLLEHDRKERSKTESNEFNESDETDSRCSPQQNDSPFRNRASTDGTIFSRPRRWRYPPPGAVVSHSSRVERRMSISMRGSNASY